jgi:hypothetical protein
MVRRQKMVQRRPIARRVDHTGNEENGVLSLFSPFTRTQVEFLRLPNAGYESWNSNEIIYPLTRLSDYCVQHG